MLEAILSVLGVAWCAAWMVYYMKRVNVLRARIARLRAQSVKDAGTISRLERELKKK